MLGYCSASHQLLGNASEKMGRSMISMWKKDRCSLTHIHVIVLFYVTICNIAYRVTKTIGECFVMNRQCLMLWKLTFRRICGVWHLLLYLCWRLTFRMGSVLRSSSNETEKSGGRPQLDKTKTKRDTDGTNRTIPRSDGHNSCHKLNVMKRMKGHRHHRRHRSFVRPFKKKIKISRCLGVACMILSMCFVPR